MYNLYIYEYLIVIVLSSAEKKKGVRSHVNIFKFQSSIGPYVWCNKPGKKHQGGEGIIGEFPTVGHFFTT